MSDLELPRHVHRADGIYCLVSTPAELESALTAGWRLQPPAVGASAPLVQPAAPEAPAAPIAPILESAAPALVPPTRTRKNPRRQTGSK